MDQLRLQSKSLQRDRVGVVDHGSQSKQLQPIFAQQLGEMERHFGTLKRTGTVPTKVSNNPSEI